MYWFQDTRLASFLPKSGIINRVERIDEKLLVVQLKQLFIFVETVDLTVVGKIDCGVRV